MNQNSVRVSANEIFRSETLSFADISHQSKLFLDFQADAENLDKFYPEKESSIEKFAARVLQNYEVDRDYLCDILAEINQSFGAGSKTIENIETLREADCVTIVTGQQAGIFSGALYTIYKIVSAIKYAEDLRARNIKAVPIFWIAEEDHDFDEVKKTFNLDKEGKLFDSENAPADLIENAPVGLIKLDETINETIAALFENLPRTLFTDETRNLLAATYQPNETYSVAFAKFLTALFADYGLIILTPLNLKLKKLCAPIFTRIIEKSDEIAAALLRRNAAIEHAGYQAQVLVAENFFPFFYQDESGARLALRRSAENAKIEIQHSKREFSRDELREIARNEPQKLSPNALTRPVVQDYLLPTLTYFGGAAEIAYFAQNSAIYENLNRPATPIQHRASFTVIERKHGRTLEKYNLKFVDLFAGRESVSAGIVENFLNRNTARIFSDVKENIDRELNFLEQELINNEPTLAANLVNRREKILWHLGALRKKYHQAEILKDEVTKRRIDNLFAALLPNDALQERSLSVGTFLNLFGRNFIDWIYQAADANIKEHQILYL